MLSNRLKAATTIGLISALLLGCVSLEYKTPEQRTLESSAKLSDYESNMDKKYSEAMFLTYLTTRVSPTKKNNLDSVYSYTQERIGLVSSVLAADNIYTAAMGAIGFSSQMKDMNYKLRQNTLFTVTPVKSHSPKDISESIKLSKLKLSTVINHAYLTNNFANSVGEFDLINDGLTKYVNAHLYFPLDEASNVIGCIDPELFNSYSNLTADPEFKPNNFLPLSITGCAIFVDNDAKYYEYDTNLDSTLLPRSDFIIQYASVPALFPIMNLAYATQDDSVYLYQPSRSSLGEKNLKEMLKSNPEFVRELWDVGTFSENARVIKISTGEVLNFGVQ